jgi:cytochrome c oxidase assembly protein subunit 11
MGALSYAAVPLYKMFCQATGFGGTTQVAIEPSKVMLDQLITVRFDANVAPGLGWSFEPLQATMTVKLGENALAFYKATNTTDKVLKGTASFNVSPDLAGQHFSKIECFCFQEQTLKPGESVEMPVSFFVDPKLAADRDANWIKEITLSYTFYASGGTGQGS